jgi:hypothetical protein
MIFSAFGRDKIPPLVLQEGQHYQTKTPLWSFVGSVPADLAYRCTANDPEQREYLLRAAAHSGPGIARGIAAKWGCSFETAFWATEEAALAAAAAVGAHVTQVCPKDTSRWRMIPHPDAEKLMAVEQPKRRTRRAV